MRTKQGANWLNFGTPQNTVQTNSLKLKEQLLDNFDQGLKQKLGRSMLNIIKTGKRLLDSNALKGEMQTTYYVAVHFARNDFNKLVLLHVRATNVYWQLYDSKKKHAIQNIVHCLHQLILQQAQIMSDTHCPVHVDELSLITAEWVMNEFFTDLCELIRSGQYRKVAVILLKYHFVFDIAKAEKLYTLTQETIKHHSKKSEEFLSFLNVRLFTCTKSPETIDYSSLKGDFKCPRSSDSSASVFVDLRDLLEALLQTINYLTEATLKEHYKDWIVKKVDALWNELYPFSNEKTH